MTVVSSQTEHTETIIGEGEVPEAPKVTTEKTAEQMTEAENSEEAPENPESPKTITEENAGQPSEGYSSQISEGIVSPSAPEAEFSVGSSKAWPWAVIGGIVVLATAMGWMLNRRRR